MKEPKGGPSGREVGAYEGRYRKAIESVTRVRPPRPGLVKKTANTTSSSFFFFSVAQKLIPARIVSMAFFLFVFFFLFRGFFCIACQEERGNGVPPRNHKRTVRIASNTRWPRSGKIKQRNQKERGRGMKAGQPTPLSERRNESSGEDPAGISLATVDRDVHRRTTSEKRLGLERCHLSPLVFLDAFRAHTYTKECCPSGRLQSIDYKACTQCRLLYGT